MKPLDQKGLAAKDCGHPECTSPHDLVVLHARCHFGAPTMAVYDKKAGALVLLCMVCRTPIMTVAVAKEAPDDVQLDPELMPHVEPAKGLN